MKWMCIILALGGGPRYEKYDLTYEQCELWKLQQGYSPQYPLPNGPLLMTCEPYWEA